MAKLRVPARPRTGGINARCAGAGVGAPPWRQAWPPRARVFPLTHAQPNPPARRRARTTHSPADDPIIRLGLFRRPWQCLMGFSRACHPSSARPRAWDPHRPSTAGHSIIAMDAISRVAAIADAVLAKSWSGISVSPPKTGGCRARRLRARRVNVTNGSGASASCNHTGLAALAAPCPPPPRPSHRRLSATFAPTSPALSAALAPRRARAQPSLLKPPPPTPPALPAGAATPAPSRPSPEPPPNPLPPPPKPAPPRQPVSWSFTPWTSKTCAAP